MSAAENPCISDVTSFWRNHCLRVLVPEHRTTLGNFTLRASPFIDGVVVDEQRSIVSMLDQSVYYLRG